ncbi:MAG: efflux RND transporter periplasmic adaptor subunit [Hespellia sp.]|nr:efflux RND transporter periplasmic adaptor subunit [Hespellia sp.]
MFRKGNKKNQVEQESMIDQAEQLENESDLDQVELEDKNEQADQIKKKGKKPKKKAVIAVIAGCAVIGGIAFAVQSMNSSASGTAVEVAAVKKGDVVSSLNITGDVTSANTKTYFSPVNATINTCNGENGTTVDSGALIIGYDTTTLAQDNQKAQLQNTVTASGNQDVIEKANQASARTTRDEDSIQADIDSTQAHVAELNSWIAERTNELASDSTQSMTDATIAYQNAASELDTMTSRMKDIEGQLEDLEKKISAATEEEKTGYDDTKAQLTQEKATLEEAISAKTVEVRSLDNEKTRVAGMTATPATDGQIVAWNNELTSAQAELSSFQAELATAQGETKAVATAEVTSAAKEQMNAQNNLSELAALTTEQLLEKGQEGMKTEFKGVLTDVKVKQGELVTQGQELFTVVSNENVYVKVPVSKSDYDKVEVGQSAGITIGKKAYQGTVTEISKIATKTEKGAEVIYTKVRVDNADSDIYLGVQAKVRLNVGNVKNVLCVDSAAINTDSDGDFCYVVGKDSKVVRKNVTVGLGSSDSTEVKDGIKEGDQVIRELPDGVEEGSVVTAQKSASKEAKTAEGE